MDEARAMKQSNLYRTPSSYDSQNASYLRLSLLQLIGVPRNVEL